MKSIYHFSLFFVLVAVLTLQSNAETFYLKSKKSGRMFGPYVYGQGETVTVGKVIFEILREPGAENELGPIPLPAADAEPLRNPEAETAAMEAIGPWLDLIDGDNFDKAWEQAAEYLKLALPQAEFAKSLRAVRETLGHVVSRKLKSYQYAESLPSAPDGKYVIIHFSTTMARKRQAIETIIPMLADDGTWRVSGYYLR